MLSRLIRCSFVQGDLRKFTRRITIYSKNNCKETDDKESHFKAKWKMIKKEKELLKNRELNSENKENKVEKPPVIKTILLKDTKDEITDKKEEKPITLPSKTKTIVTSISEENKEELKDNTTQIEDKPILIPPPPFLAPKTEEKEKIKKLPPKPPSLQKDKTLLTKATGMPIKQSEIKLDENEIGSLKIMDEPFDPSKKASDSKIKNTFKKEEKSLDSLKITYNTTVKNNLNDKSSQVIEQSLMASDKKSKDSSKKEDKPCPPIPSQSSKIPCNSNGNDNSNKGDKPPPKPCDPIDKESLNKDKPCPPKQEVKPCPPPKKEEKPCPPPKKEEKPCPPPKPCDPIDKKEEKTSPPPKQEVKLSSPPKQEVKPSPPPKQEIKPCPPTKKEEKPCPPPVPCPPPKPCDPIDKKEEKPSQLPKQEVKPSPPPKQEVKPSPPPKQEVKPSPPPKQEVKPSPPPKQEVKPSPPPKQEVKPSLPPKKEEKPCPPISCEQVSKDLKKDDKPPEAPKVVPDSKEKDKQKKEPSPLPDKSKKEKASKTADLKSSKRNLAALIVILSKLFPKGKAPDGTFPQGPRDLVNFPRPARLYTNPPVRHGFIPEQFFNDFYKHTGFLGPYVLFFTVGTFLFSKELYVCEHEFYGGLGTAVSIILVTKKFGPMLGKYLDQNCEIYLENLTFARDSALLNFENLLEYEKKIIFFKEGNMLIFPVKQENVRLLLEAIFRERQMKVYEKVKKLLDYQVGEAPINAIKNKQVMAQSILEEFHIKNQKRWIREAVLAALTPEIQSNILKYNFIQLKELGEKYNKADESKEAK